MVTNTARGDGTVVTVGLNKAFNTMSTGRWTFDFGYTWQDVDETRSYNRFVGFETYAFDPQTDLNSASIGPSKYEVENRFTMFAAWQKQLIGNATTSASVAYSGRSGRRYSYVFGSGTPIFGGTFLADFGSEADNPGSQLFYVPTGVDDPIITGDPGFLADLNTFIDGDSCLNGSRGSVVTRNSCQTGWVHIINVRLQQEILAWGDTAFDVFLDIENIGNLINDDWGQVDSYPAPSNVAPAIVDLSEDGSQYVLLPTASYQGTPESVIVKPSIASLPSVYRVQIGARFRF